MCRIISGAAPSTQGRMRIFPSSLDCMKFLGNIEAYSGYIDYTFFRLDGMQHSIMSNRVDTRSMTHLIRYIFEVCPINIVIREPGVAVPLAAESSL